MKKYFYTLTIFTLVCCIIFSFSGSSSSYDAVEKNQNDNFINTSKQQLYLISWKVYSLDGVEGGIAYPFISPFEANSDYTISQQINDSIGSFLEIYTSSFIEGSFFNLSCQIMRFDDLWLSIKYQGEVWTPAKALGEAFSLNFDMNTGEMLTLGDVFDIESVLYSLKNGRFSQFMILQMPFILLMS